MDKHLHIVSFDVPYLANYGGVMDVYYRAKALSEAGIKVHLHCYEYGRPHADILNSFCESVSYYQRDMSWKLFLSKDPFIVASRCSQQLVSDLLNDNYPILLEGLHTCALMNVPQLSAKRFYVRAHNIEHEYYSNLARAERKLPKKYYLKLESAKLLRFESVLNKAQGVFAIQQSDADYFAEQYSKVMYLPSFNPFNQVSVNAGIGDFALYHGKLSVPENEKAARFLIEQVFSKLPYRLVVAGAEPTKSLLRLTEKYDNVELVDSPDDDLMFELIRNAQVNVLYTNQATGLKLKLLNVLYNGRFCLVNDKMLSGTDLAPLCLLADTAEDYRKQIDSIFKVEFAADLDKRKELLQKYDNEANAFKIVNWIFGNQ